MCRILYKSIRHTTLFGKARIIKPEIIPECATLLDLGCGSESPIEKLTHKISYSVGVDISEESISLSKKAKIHHEYKKMNVLDIEKVFAPKSFDCVVAFELIEHLTKKDGLQLLNMMEKIARKKIIISTPNGFIEQNEYDNNPFQIHRSGWSYYEIKKMGFRIIGNGGWKSLRGLRGRIIWKPRIFWFLVSRFSQFYTKSHPEHAFDLICIKDLEIDK